MSNILFVFEGENTEDKLVNSLTKYFFKDKTLIKCAFCAEIYQLHRAISPSKTNRRNVRLQQMGSILSTYTYRENIPLSSID